MWRKWCVNSKTGLIFSYCIFSEDDGENDGYKPGETDFPHWMLLLYEDYLTTGIASHEEAKK